MHTYQQYEWITHSDTFWLLCQSLPNHPCYKHPCDTWCKFRFHSAVLVHSFNHFFHLFFSTSSVISHKSNASFVSLKHFGQRYIAGFIVCLPLITFLMFWFIHYEICCFGFSFTQNKHVFEWWIISVYFGERASILLVYHCVM